MVLETVAIPFRFSRDGSTTIYASSKLNRVGRRAARYDSGLTAHKCNRPAHKRPAPHRIAREQIACSRSRCGNLSILPPMNPHGSDANEQPTLLHNHARYDAEGRIVSMNGGAATYEYDAEGNRVRKTVSGASVDYIYDLAGRQIAEINSSGGANREEIYAAGQREDQPFLLSGRWRYCRGLVQLIRTFHQPVFTAYLKPVH